MNVKAMRMIHFSPINEIATFMCFTSKNIAKKLSASMIPVCLECFETWVLLIFMLNNVK